MVMTAPKQDGLGLALSGGGARGAYEVGVIKAMAHLGLEPSVVSGASIGALNGAVVASAPSMDEAAERLEVIWTGLKPDKIISLNHHLGRYLALAALRLALARLLFAGGASLSLAEVLRRHLNRMLDDEDQQYLALLDSGPIEQIVLQALDVDQLLSPQARELYVSVFPASDHGGLQGLLLDLWRYLRSRDRSEFIRARDCKREEIIKLLLASAAIPLAFRPIHVQSRLYRDGFMGDWFHCQGNTPVEPLARCGCTRAVAVLIGDGALFNRYEWNVLTLLEIRPSRPLCCEGELRTALDFNPRRIRELMRQGEEDALQSLGQIKRLLSESRQSDLTFRRLNQERSALHQSDSEIGRLIRELEKET